MASPRAGGVRLWSVPAGLAAPEVPFRATLALASHIAPWGVGGDRRPSPLAPLPGERGARAERGRGEGSITGAIAALEIHYGDLPAVGDVLELLSRPARVLLVADSISVAPLLASLPPLRAADRALAVPPLPGAGPAAQAAASLSIPIELRDLGGWSLTLPNELAELRDYYLESPTLETPIDPWHTLAVSMSESGSGDLWDITEERIGVHLYVDDSGGVTLSPRFAAAGRFFGSTGDTPDALESSDLWRELADRRITLFRERTKCSFCRHYRWCGGYWMSFGDDSLALCEQWLGHFDVLLAAKAAIAETEEGRHA